ncbi:hypothetical protein RDABS01_027594 [Bienertia sinuspersici]
MVDDPLIDDPLIDVVYMPLPTSLHVEWAVLAASKKKHVLLEKPTALDSTQLQQILDACEANNVQFMDGTMWYHHPRTDKIKHVISDSPNFGTIQLLPTYITALPEVTLNSKGIILACIASFHWEEEPKKNATFYCSFLSHVSMDLVVHSSRGSVHVHDLAIPYRENSASFLLTTKGKGKEEVVVESRLPQEALMVQEFARLIDGIKSNERCSEKMWPEISRKTQLALDAVRKSVEIVYKPVYL